VEVRPGERVFEDNVPAMSRGFTITAHLAAPLTGDDHGVLAEQGDHNGGWVWYLDPALGQLVFVCSYVSEHLTRLVVPAPAGARMLRLTGQPDGESVKLLMATDQAELGDGRLPHAWPGLWTPNSSATLLVGRGRPLPVCDGYDPADGFTGALDRLVVEAGTGPSPVDLDHQAAVALRSD
jgi:hypothetical protein